MDRESGNGKTFLPVESPGLAGELARLGARLLLPVRAPSSCRSSGKGPWLASIDPRISSSLALIYKPIKYR